MNSAARASPLRYWMKSRRRKGAIFKRSWRSWKIYGWKSRSLTEIADTTKGRREGKRCLGLSLKGERESRRIKEKGAFEMNKRSTRLKRPLHPMPEFVRAALESRNLIEAYLRRPAYQQNDYIGWITRAKLPATRPQAARTNARRAFPRRCLHENGLSSEEIK